MSEVIKNSHRNLKIDFQEFKDNIKERIENLEKKNEQLANNEHLTNKYYNVCDKYNWLIYEYRKLENKYNSMAWAEYDSPPQYLNIN